MCILFNGGFFGECGVLAFFAGDGNLDRMMPRCDIIRGSRPPQLLKSPPVQVADPPRERWRSARLEVPLESNTNSSTFARTL
jgi:hypothetical protein